MSGRNLRSRKSLEGAIAGPEGMMAEVVKRDEPQRKRQRRLTAHQRGPHELKLVPALVAVPAAKQQQQPAPAQAAHKPKSKRQPEAQEAAPPRADAAGVAPSAGAGASSLSPGYVSDGPSVKMAPGKRIKWRGVIPEEDNVRQDLSQRFAAMEAAAAAGGRKRL